MTGGMHIVFSGGGTGGHLFPGLAVAQALMRKQPGARITFCGTGKPWEHDNVTRHGYAYRSFPASPLRMRPVGLFKTLVANGLGYRAARQWIQSDRPAAVVGLGGYASLPACLAALRAGVPAILLEQNLVPGQANRLLAHWSSIICTMFEESDGHFSSRPEMLHTGNPVRGEIAVSAANRASHAAAYRDSHPTLLVLGGSQGAHSLNDAVVEVLAKIAPLLADWEVIHQTGARDEAWVRAAYESHRIRSTVAGFIDDMAGTYARSTLAISRAGGTTLAELSVSGVPAILLPYPHASANHQWHNAQVFGRAGAAIVVDDRPERGRTPSALVSALTPLLRLPELRREMRLAMLKLARPDAADSVAATVLELASRSGCARQSA